MTRQPPPEVTAARPLVIDGGLSNALHDRGHDLSDALWSARLLRDAPEEVAAVHRAYARAGAEVLTTASYQASTEGFERAGAGRTESRRLVGSSVVLARRVRDALAGDGVRRWVAASVGPYGAVLADGSEYRGRYGVDRRVLRDFHAERLELLAAEEPDLLAVETIPDVDEAEVLVPLLDDLAVPAWLTYTIGATSGRTRAGQPLRAAFQTAAGASCVRAVGVNCCAPAAVAPALRVAADATGLPLVAYPNSGEVWDPAVRGWAGAAEYDPVSAGDWARRWVAAGAGLVGGCCRVGPATVAAVAAALRSP